MNTVFHLASLGALIGLVYLLLKARRERDILRSLLLGQGRGPKRLTVALPSHFLRDFAQALGIPFAGDSPRSEVAARLTPGPLTELFLHSGLSLIRCLESPSGSSGKLVVELRTTVPPLDPEAAVKLSAALGGQAEVRLLPPSTP